MEGENDGGGGTARGERGEGTGGGSTVGVGGELRKGGEEERRRNQRGKIWRWRESREKVYEEVEEVLKVEENEVEKEDEGWR